MNATCLPSGEGTASEVAPRVKVRRAVSARRHASGGQPPYSDFFGRRHSAGIYFAVVTIAKHTVSAYGKEAHGMGLETAYRFTDSDCAGCKVYTLNEPLLRSLRKYKVFRPARGRGCGLLLHGPSGWYASCSGIIHPDVPRNGRSVMLAPFVFKSLAVLIKKGIPRRIKADQFGRCSPAPVRFFLQKREPYTTLSWLKSGTWHLPPDPVCWQRRPHTFRRV